MPRSRYTHLHICLHDLRLETDLARHDPNSPNDPPPTGNPEEGMPYDVAKKGTANQNQTRSLDAYLHLLSIIGRIVQTF